MSENINSLPEMKPIRRKLRRHMTAAEVALWVMVKNRQLVGERFLRQFSIGHFVVDFYCPKYKLGIELDGAGHFTEAGREKDNKRTGFLNSQGIRIIRFENFEVFEFPERTLEEIKRNLREEI
jgi:very-short-patch-repair endonuclease